ncbi:hypothetical protein E2C01_082653 [Portunus trituberculatus]|uniref:Uncharacterized protein n=1 Tax=Portunus trituberculatus TaxID=210409 RepID=A0A5B7ISX0_PORTR|nr:hypothetical protein [Portunus trituberculatus]
MVDGSGCSVGVCMAIGNTSPQPPLSYSTTFAVFSHIPTVYPSPNLCHCLFLTHLGATFPNPIHLFYPILLPSSPSTVTVFLQILCCCRLLPLFSPTPPPRLTSASPSRLWPPSVYTCWLAKQTRHLHVTITGF